MTTIREFLSARIGEEELLAQSAIDTHDSGDPWDYQDLPGDGAHITHWSPYRVMNTCIVKRLMVSAHREVLRGTDDDGNRLVRPIQECVLCGLRPDGQGVWPCYTLRVLALDYTNHVDYRPEWRPPALRELRELLEREQRSR